MYSQCPECLTRFRVTAAALRVAHGTVRCGRCGSAFDALSRLSDTLQDTGTDSGPAQPADLLDTGSVAGTTAAGMLAADESAGDTEFQFSAEDIDNVFIDVRDWQSQFGSPASPGDRAGKLGDTSSAELRNMLKPEFTGEEDPAESADSRVWVHEPESVEDITLEGERIEIEGSAAFEEDFLEREIEKELEEQHRAEITGTQRVLESAPPAGDMDDEFIADDAVPLPDLEPLYDPDSTDQFEILRDVPEATYALEDAANDAAATPLDEAAEQADPPPMNPVVLGMPAAVATAAAGIESAAAGDAPAEGSSRPVHRAAPWRRVAEAAAEEVAADAHEHDPQLAEDLAAAAGARTASWAWGVGALLLALVLATQLVHHFRLELARNPNVGPALRAVYERIGRPLPPNWNLAAFELRQWGASDATPTGAGSMSVRASIRNGAAFAQPMPLLRLELEDRFGGTVARRDFSPREYLKDPAQASRLLTPGTAIEAELAVVDAPADAVGYRLDVCLREESDAVRCAQASEAAPGTGLASP